jgi:hypothetical protein
VQTDRQSQVLAVRVIHGAVAQQPAKTNNPNVSPFRSAEGRFGSQLVMLKGSIFRPQYLALADPAAVAAEHSRHVGDVWL